MCFTPKHCYYRMTTFFHKAAKKGCVKIALFDNEEQKKSWLDVKSHTKTFLFLIKVLL